MRGMFLDQTRDEPWQRMQETRRRSMMREIIKRGTEESKAGRVALTVRLQRGNVTFTTGANHECPTDRC